MKAHIITIGDEILIGQTVDTNAAWLGAKLNETGLIVEEVLTISDEKKAIEDAVRGRLDKADLIIVTGGLGPTRDDVTKKTLCDLFGGKLVRNKEIEEKISGF